jgi:hypothetical protein
MDSPGECVDCRGSFLVSPLPPAFLISPQRITLRTCPARFLSVPLSEQAFDELRSARSFAPCSGCVFLLLAYVEICPAGGTPVAGTGQGFPETGGIRESEGLPLLRGLVKDSWSGRSRRALTQPIFSSDRIPRQSGCCSCGGSRASSAIPASSCGRRQRGPRAFRETAS